MTTFRTAKTQDGMVVRIINAGGECAYRQHFDGSCAKCCGHKGPWISCNYDDLPDDVKGEMRRGWDAVVEDARQHIPCHGVAP